MYGKHKKICPPVRMLNMGGILLYEQLDSLRNRNSMSMGNTAPVSTPGYMGGYAEWPKPNNNFSS